jgi:hypothetical protein
VIVILLLFIILVEYESLVDTIGTSCSAAAFDFTHCLIKDWRSFVVIFLPYNLPVLSRFINFLIAKKRLVELIFA